MKKLLITLGPSGSGKTTFAKKYARDNNGEYIDFDLVFSYKEKDFKKFTEVLRGLLQNDKKELFVLDGYISYNSPSLESLEDELGVEINMGVCFAPPHVIRERQKIKAETLHIDEPDNEITIRDTITNLYFFLLSSARTNSLLIETTNGLSILDPKEFPQKWQELIFLSYLENMPHDRHYQDILLPSGTKISGYSNSGETWARLGLLIDFTGKSVIDYGPFHGYMSFCAENSGAKKVIGIEKNKDALNIARYAAWLKKSKVLFLEGDMETYRPEETFDIGLILNMLHHVPDQIKAMGNVFSSVHTAIFEINFDQETTVKSAAKQHGFELKSEMSSERGARKILAFQSIRADVAINKNAEKNFKFNPSQYGRQKVIRRLKRILKSLRIFILIKYLFQKLRKF